MSNYKRNVEANRNALFASSSSPGGTRKPASKPKTSSTTLSTGATSTSTNASGIRSNPTTSRISKVSRTTTLSGSAKAEKMKEAEGYRAKAKKAMEKTLFSSPDPIAAAMFYHRAAESYKACGENRLERLHRIASGDCQLGHGAHATAASEYTRAAELSEVSDETDARKRNECCKLYSDAAKAWTEIGETGKAGESLFKSAFSLLIGLQCENVVAGRSISGMDKNALRAIEEAVESHVPDPLNRYRQFRQTGKSIFLDESDDEATTSDDFDEETLELCRNHMVTSSFGHETLFKAVNKLIEWGEYSSALYATGAASKLLESDGHSTISLSRAYCVETILCLAIGDVVAADNYFVQVHLQRDTYLTSRECKLSEDLIRAIKSRNIDELDEARSSSGDNIAAIAHLDAPVKGLINGLRIAGVAKVEDKKPSSGTSSEEPTSSSGNDNGNNDVYAEMDDLMNDMGLGSPNDEDNDDDIDLR